MSIGKRYWEFTHGDMPLHKWKNKMLPMPDDFKVGVGDVVHVEINTDGIVIVLNPTDPPEGFKPMDPEESK